MQRDRHSETPGRNAQRKTDRDKVSKTNRPVEGDRGKGETEKRPTLRKSLTHAHARAHTHTHTHGAGSGGRQMERRKTEKRPTLRKSLTHAHAHTHTHTGGREQRHKRKPKE